jgi:hypothetical protein
MPRDITGAETYGIRKCENCGESLPAVLANLRKPPQYFCSVACAKAHNTKTGETFAYFEDQFERN